MPSGDMDPGMVALQQEVREKIMKLAFRLCLLYTHIPIGVFHAPALSQFLLRVLTGWVQAIDDDASGITSPALPSSGPKAEWWPSLCLELGSLLQVNPDILRRHLVCELYNQGLDLRAEEVMGNSIPLFLGMSVFCSDCSSEMCVCVLSGDVRSGR